MVDTVEKQLRNSNTASNVLFYYLPYTKVDYQNSMLNPMLHVILTENIGCCIAFETMKKANGTGVSEQIALVTVFRQEWLHTSLSAHLSFYNFCYCYLSQDSFRQIFFLLRKFVFASKLSSLQFSSFNMNLESRKIKYLLDQLNSLLTQSPRMN